MLTLAIILLVVGLLVCLLAHRELGGVVALVGLALLLYVLLVVPA